MILFIFQKKEIVISVLLLQNGLSIYMSFKLFLNSHHWHQKKINFPYAKRESKDKFWEVESFSK